MRGTYYPFRMYFGCDTCTCRVHVVHAATTFDRVTPLTIRGFTEVTCARVSLFSLTYDSGPAGSGDASASMMIINKIIVSDPLASARAREPDDRLLDRIRFRKSVFDDIALHDQHLADTVTIDRVVLEIDWISHFGRPYPGYPFIESPRVLV